MQVHITDTDSSTLSRSEQLPWLVKSMFPLPRAFREVWSQLRGDAPLFVWEPLPPSADFVALGVVCSSSPHEPPRDRYA